MSVLPSSRPRSFRGDPGEPPSRAVAASSAEPTGEGSIRGTGGTPSTLLQPGTWLAGLQWLLFMFTNTVVIPITVGAAFDLPHSRVVALMQASFTLVGLACVAQALFGHERPIMEGQSGLWWAVLLSLAFTASAHGVSLETLGGSVTIGIFIAAALNIAIGVSGAGYYLAKLFSPGVMGVFMFLFGVKLVAIFMKGMLGLPFGEHTGIPTIDLSVSLLSIAVVALVTIITVKASPRLARYALLIGIIIGWAAWVLLFPSASSGRASAPALPTLFPLGAPVWNTGIVITAVITGLLNLANTFGALKGTEAMYRVHTTRREYRRSLTISGVFVGLSGLLGLVPFAPYVSSIGFLDQTGIRTRTPFVIGGLMFVLMGIVAPIGHFFSLLPLSIGAAVLFVPYLLLLHSSLQFFRQIQLNTLNVYRSAIPLFVGIVTMTLPSGVYASMPAMIRPLLSSGLLVGIILALLMENLVHWDRYAPRSP